MKKINFIRPGFRHADDGVTVITYAEGEREVSDRCAEVAEAEGFAIPLEESEAKSDKGKPGRQSRASGKGKQSAS
jgi:hypothetical protein